MQAERVTIENAQGDVTISRLVGASQVQVTDQLGNIALTLGEKADSYSVQAACGLGSITVSGAKQASPYSANSKAANAVILDAALGDITLNFEELAGKRAPHVRHAGTHLEPVPNGGRVPMCKMF